MLQIKEEDLKRIILQWIDWRITEGLPEDIVDCIIEEIKEINPT